MDEANITFRELAESDFDKLHGWLNEEHVRERWGNKDVSREDVQKKYGPMITGKEPTLGFIIAYDGKPVGFIQTYKINDYRKYKAQIGIDENAAGLDLFIGDKDYIGKGLGSLVIKKFVREIVFTKFDVVSCIADPAENNGASIRAFEKAGFKYLKHSQDPETGEKELVLICTRMMARRMI